MSLSCEWTLLLEFGVQYSNETMAESGSLDIPRVPAKHQGKIANPDGTMLERAGTRIVSNRKLKL